MKLKKDQSVLSDDEVRAIVSAIRAKSPDEGDEGICHVLEWATHTRLQADLLLLVLSGKLICQWDSKASVVRFFSPEFAVEVNVQ